MTSTLVARGEIPRHAIGSAALAEFLVTAAISATFVATLDLAAYGRVVLGLIIGGALAAPARRLVQPHPAAARADGRGGGGRGRARGARLGPARGRLIIDGRHRPSGGTGAEEKTAKIP